MYKIGVTATCEFCSKAIKFGTPEPSPLEIKYQKYFYPLPKPTEPYWFHINSRLKACDMQFAKPAKVKDCGVIQK